jgi:hypothetical protein
MTHRKRHQRFKLKSLYVWHRYIGLAAALFVILLSITGIALNHTGALKLDHRFVQSTLLLDWYGIEAPTTATHYRVGEKSIALLGTQLFIDAKQLDGEITSLTGALLQNDLLIVGEQDGLLLLTLDGQLIERLGRNEGLPHNIERLGTTSENQLIVATSTGLYSTDANYLKWTAGAGHTENIAWSLPSQLAETEMNALQTRFRGQILPWERVMLDMHSGRFFGTWGPWLMDAAALLMLFLAGSGVIIWCKRQR